MKKYRYLPVLFLLFFLPPITAAATTYYIDSGTGNDGNSGTSESLPWRSFTNVNNRTLAAGDRILLKSGAVWAGQQLAPRGSGTQSAPIIIDSYGGDARPVIDGNGMSSTTETWTEAMILLRNVQYWEISNIEITNAYSVQTRSTGIWVRNDAGGVLNHFVIRNCYIHHFTNGGTSTVNDSGDIHDKHQGGIYFYGTSGNGARFNDILIEGNELAYPGRTGISIRTESAYYWSQEADCITNVVIRNNAVSYTAGDGIVVLGIKGALLEHNVVHHCATANGVRTDASASMWGGWIQIDSVYQYNEVYAHQPGGDGTAFDYDIQCRDVVHQYNYTHDNYNGMMLVCGDFQGALTIRYNISLNENIVTDVGNNSNINLWWYNNTFYKQSGSHYLKGDYVYNNILYGSANHTIEAGSHDYNNMYPGGPGESHAVFSNPQFVSPGQVPTGRLNVTGYKLQPGSPNINAGMVITNNGGYDYWGTALSDGRPDIGFTEYTTNTATNTPVSGSTATPTPASNGAMIPGTIEAENYTAMSGIQTESCSEGGLNVGWIEAGDWMDYTVQINTEGTYSVSYRVASLSAGGQLQLQIGSTTYHTVSFGATGGWQTWTTVNGTATLPSGNQTIRIYASQTGWNINYMTFALNSSTSTPTMVLTTAPTVTPTRTPTPAATGTPQATATATPTPTNAAGLTDITDLAGTVSAQYTDSPSGEDIEKLIDNNTSTKYLTFHASGWTQFQGVNAIVSQYTISSANDAAERDPYTWTLQGSNNGSTWTMLDSRTGEDFPNRFQTRSFSFTNSTAYSYYRLNMTNNSGTILQLSEWELFGVQQTSTTSTPTPTRTPAPTATGTTQATATTSPTPTPTQTNATELTDITDLAGTISAQYTDSPSGEDIEKLIDNNTSTKYLTFHASGWTQFQGVNAIVSQYTISSANDAAERDPYTWTLQGSNNGSTWTTLDSRTGEDFPNRFQTRSFSLTNSTAYSYYRLNMTNNSGTILQLSEWELFGVQQSAGTSTPTPVRTSTPTAAVTPQATPSPAGIILPDLIEAENYTAMSGIQTESCSEGGLNVGWIEAGDWMDYAVYVPAAGTYTFDYRVASLSAGGALQLRIGNTTYHTVSFTATGGWQTWTTVSATALLPSGNQTLRIYSSQTGWNINYFNIHQ